MPLLEYRAARGSWPLSPTLANNSLLIHIKRPPPVERIDPRTCEKRVSGAGQHHREQVAVLLGRCQACRNQVGRSRTLGLPVARRTQIIQRRGIFAKARMILRL